MTIRLHLTNFRCWENKTFTFSEKGVLLLSGISGKGKSTILNAILWCVTGSMKNISTAGKDATSVIFEIDHMIITRTKKPSRLTIKKDNLLYEDDEAQALIDQTLGKEFKNISYIDQDNQYSFVYLSPQDKMSFLRDLLLQEYNIDSIKDKVKVRMEAAKKEIIKEDATIRAASSFLEKIKPCDNNLTIQKRVITKANIDNTLETMTSNLETAEKNKKVMSAKIAAIEKEYKMYVSYQRLLEERSMYGNEEEIKQTLTRLEEQHKTYKQMCIDKEKYEMYQKQSIKLSNATTERDRIPIDHIKKKISLLQTIITHQKMIPTVSEEEYEKLENQRDCIRKNRDEVAASLSTYMCPSCTTPLLLDQGELHIAKISESVSGKKTSADLRQAEKELQEAEKKLAAYDSKIDTYNEYIEKVEGLVNEYNALDDVSVDVSSDFTPILQTNRAIEQSHQMLCHTITSIQKEMSPVSPTLPSCIDPVDLDQIASLREKMKQLARIEKSLKEYESISTSDGIDHTKLESFREKQKEYEEKCSLYTKHIQCLHNWKRIDADQQTFMEWTANAQKSRDKIEYYTDEVKCCERLANYIKESETKSLIEFIYSLNQHASVYIGHFFPDEDIHIELTTNKELKSGKDKVGLFFDVSYRTLKGDLEFLSGGQKDRVNLAFTLAFSELVSNRLLLLDECISSLDSETSSTVIDTLREKSTHKLVLCVAHQVTAGSFDEVIEI